ncbi:AsnC family transcriptional regulator [Desulfatibacillum aliphaticivorans]|uniref:siroheme decarboxylase n=1 Tax=Desulfatibacillum aliphaticivorans TaxID=218208 RepID=B8FMV6_DESAL|nr:AsnC family transcriptional regulator [Desulfatibacillum aliphaticivorans]ACL05826.1 putative transcriptional regulator, AsnC family [Desulfatibacillum aliphaticivorans]
MDATDKAIINRIQSDFPRTERPYASIGEEFGLDEAQVIERVSRLKESGIIRRIGGNFVPDKLGFVSTLCAARVPEGKVEMFTEAVNQYPGVTHNYLRENDYNIWFTFISPSMDEIKANLSEISAKTGVEDIINLPATNVYKIRAQFEL